MHQEISGHYFLWRKGKLRHLRVYSGTDQTIILIRDLHASHRAASIKKLAAELNIEIHYIPAGATDLLQPLNRLVFGILKSQARRLFRARVSEDPFHRRTKNEACEDMMTAWDQISAEALQASWELYEEETWREEDEDADTDA
jgi:hypothetical protein